MTMVIPLQSRGASASIQQPQQAQQSEPQRANQTFEFTRRKKWASILLSEQPDTVIVILDYDIQVQYVGPGMRDVLGWEVEELVDTDFLEIVNSDDKMGLSDRVKTCLNSDKNNELSCYTRMKCKPGSLHFSSSASQQSQKELLFEFRGRRLPEYDGSQYKLIILTGKPYPSRNTAILNTFLELAVENERLNERIASLKLEQQYLDTEALLMPKQSVGQNNSSYTPYTSTSFGYSSTRDEVQTPQSPISPSASKAPHTKEADASYTEVKEEEDTDGNKRKKSKKAPPGQAQYVCVSCGRTDSPEWRKGPKGPKTLCNACGLRWAKRAKHPEDESPRSLPAGGNSSNNSRTSLNEFGAGGGRSGKIAPIALAQLRITPPDPPPPTSSRSSTSQPMSATSQQHMPPPFPVPSPTHTTYTQAGVNINPYVTPHYAQQQHLAQSMPSASSSSSNAQQAYQPHVNSYNYVYTWPPSKPAEGSYGY